MGNNGSVSERDEEQKRAYERAQAVANRRRSFEKDGKEEPEPVEVDGMKKSKSTKELSSMQRDHLYEIAGDEPEMEPMYVEQTYGADMEEGGDGEVKMEDGKDELEGFPDYVFPPEREKRSPSGQKSGQAAKKGKKRVDISDFELLKVIGDGGYGKVTQVRKKDTGEIFALKSMHKKKIVVKGRIQHARAERHILEIIGDFPYIVSLKYAFQSQSKLYLVLEYCNGGDLYYHLCKAQGYFTEDRMMFYAAQLVLALEFLHTYDVVYRDLKLENVLLDSDGNIRLTDFGLSKEGVSEDTDAAKSYVGTVEYLAPEMIRKTGHGKAVDWWALGILMFEMLTGLPPFYAKTVPEMKRKILEERLRFPGYVSQEARDIIAGLLDRNPRTRLGSGRGVEAIKDHPFFASINWDALMRKEIRPPYKPEIRYGEADTTNFDPHYLEKMVADSPAEPVLIDKPVEGVREGNEFVNFSYYNEGGHFAALR
mmetsp:Transcript_43810/g.114257  ORF Transcript_43810/g.114257 Transcript_43810/m.114257 type:complete len:481 (-) Transcript_43810:301-1743(-)